MDKITITINTENAAFEGGNLEIELNRILQDLAKKIKNEKYPEKLRDINGNICGAVVIE